MADVLIDLGLEWGHVVPLSVLEHITHIEIMDTGHLDVTCDFDAEEKRRTFRFKSRKPFTDEQIEVEKTRLLGFSNGIVSSADMQEIVESLEKQSGVPYTETLTEPSYDISMIRQIWSSMTGLPFFRFVLHYDPESEQVLVDNNHNDHFLLKTVPNWLDDRAMRSITSTDDKLLMFAYEVIYRLVEPLLPEDEAGAFMDPNANIPMMGSILGSTTQRVDLAHTRPDQIIASTGG